MNNFSTWLTVAMLAIFTTMVGIAATYPAGAQFMPFIVGIPGILLCLLQLVLDYRTTRNGEPAVAVAPSGRAGEPALLSDDEPEFGPHTVKDEITICLYFVGFIAGLIFFGFIVSVPILIFAYLHFEAKSSVLAAALAGAATVTVMWFLFQYILNFQLHQGFATQWLLRSLG